MKLSPSILAADLTDMRRLLEGMDPGLIDFLHMDIMDGNFVPALSFGEEYTRAVARATDIPLDVHLMVAHPEREIPKYFALRPYNITFHLEATHFPIRLAQSIRAEGIRAGIALNPGSPVELLEDCLSEIDLVLIMSVEPGYYGQPFLPSTFGRLRRLQSMVSDLDIAVEVDGGVSLDNIGRLAAHGVDICVAGSACFRGRTPNENAGLLKQAASAEIAG